MTVPVTNVSPFVPSMVTERMRHAANKIFSRNSMNVGSTVGKCKEHKKWIVVIV
jgi:hypothetical protein